jgi:hypothetical protein
MTQHQRLMTGLVNTHRVHVQVMLMEMESFQLLTYCLFFLNLVVCQDVQLM